MNVKIKSLTGLRYFYNRKTLMFISLLFLLVLISSCFASMTYLSSSSGVSCFVLGESSDKVVNNEAELKAAINSAPSKTSLVITLNADISLSSALSISANKDINLNKSWRIKRGILKKVGSSFSPAFR